MDAAVGDEGRSGRVVKITGAADGPRDSRGALGDGTNCGTTRRSRMRAPGVRKRDTTYVGRRGRHAQDDVEGEAVGGRRHGWVRDDRVAKTRKTVGDGQRTRCTLDDVEGAAVGGRRHGWGRDDRVAKTQDTRRRATDNGRGVRWTTWRAGRLEDDVNGRGWSKDGAMGVDEGHDGRGGRKIGPGGKET